MNLDRNNSEIDVEQYGLVKKVPHLETFLGKWDLFQSCYYFTFVYGAFWLFWLIAVFASGPTSLGIFGIFWILPLVLSLGGVIFGMKKNKRSYMVPAVSIVFVSFFVALLTFIIEFAMLYIMTKIINYSELLKWAMGNVTKEVYYMSFGTLFNTLLTAYYWLILFSVFRGEDKAKTSRSQRFQEMVQNSFT